MIRLATASAVFICLSALPAMADGLPPHVVDSFVTCVRNKVVPGPFSSAAKVQAAIGAQDRCPRESIAFIDACVAAIPNGPDGEREKKCYVAFVLATALELERAGK